MNFSNKLNEYIKLIGCSGKELSDTSGIAAPIISGYKKGNRTPKYKSKQLDNLINALAILSKKNNISNLNEKIIREELENTLEKNDIDFEVFRNNFNLLITTLKINVSDLSKYLKYDSSFLSKIKSGIRKPYNIKKFAENICKFTIQNTNTETLKELIKCNETNDEVIYKKLYYWLTNNKYKEDNNLDVNSFMKKLDDFDLNKYIKTIKFDKLFVPTVPKFKTKTKTYYGFDGYKNAQLDVLKQAAFFKSKEDIFWYSNMPIIKASNDLKFTKKYMLYLAFILKKGIKLNIVHDLDRPFKELMLGLEGWIPLYMTCQITPYYFKNNSNFLYSIIECVSGNAILHGECITGNIEKCKMLVSSKLEDINYYKDNAKLLLKKATPLMNIYNIDKKEEFNKIIKNNIKINNARKNILLNIPIYTISNELLERILNHNNISKKDKDIIHKWIEKDINDIKTILETNEINDEITIIKKEDFINNNPILDLSKFFCDKKILYTYDEYQEHIKLLKDFKNNNKNYNYKKINKNIFNNINIHIIYNKQVIISKTNNPITHFVIHHPTLINAIENFNVPINEKDYTN